MIRSFGNKDDERIWHEQYVKRVDRTVQRATLRKLELIHAAKDVEGLRVPPGNRLEQPAGDRRGQYSIRVNAQWVSALSAEMEVRNMSNSSTSTEVDLIEPIHPGEILIEDFIEGFGITQNGLAVAIGVAPRRINEIVHGKRGSLLTRPYVWRSTSGPQRSSG